MTNRKSKMKQNFKIVFFILTIFLFTNCNTKMEKSELEKHFENDNCSTEFALNDSLKLNHIINQFYKSETGHLYEKTTAQREVDGHLTDVIYFNGSFSQEVDPLSFEQLNGWYAKDKNNIYYYRPTSGGMQIIKLKKADVKTFKILDGHYKYASDKNYFYDQTEIIEGYKPSQTIFTFDGKKRIIEMNYENKSYKFENLN